ncbi:hypothetical protein E2L92_21950 [Salmonella enterica subsp. enterica serovar Ibadan]|nr:hypothetical protein [Salmonella enterica subsp. enterica serovar Ibadan]ECF3282116.1 hypothetical protein [Salmonella enterica subsp. enterica serovar Ibadan]
MYTTDELNSHVMSIKDPALFEQWGYLRRAMQLNPPDVLKVAYLKQELTDMINSRKRLPMEWSF